MFLEDSLDKSWRSACRVLFGRGVGELGPFLPYLSEYLLPGAQRASHLSGKKVALASDRYAASAKFISAGEAETSAAQSLSINQVKDLDSVLQALSEFAEYSGNRVLGNSAYVESSDVVVDSQCVRNSTNVTGSTYVESSFMARDNSRHVFASGWGGDGEFLVRCVGYLHNRRCFETHISANVSDSYYAYYCVGCHDLMFCFSQRNKRHMIGNLQLTPEKYAALKKKLVSEIAELLEKDKCAPSLFSLVGKTAPRALPALALETEQARMEMRPIEDGFASACRVVLRHEPPGRLGDCAEWLSEGTITARSAKSPFGSTTHYPDGFPMYEALGKERLVNSEEALALSRLCLHENELASFPSIKSALGKIAFFTAEFYGGKNVNVIGTPMAMNAINVFGGYEAFDSQHAAFCTTAMNSKYVYGCGRILDSEFCLKCFDGLQLKRCFEMDGCTKCSDCYFCHNCEGLTDCMFCFNMKGARYCIGNAQLSKEDYFASRDSLLSRMAGELGKAKRLGISIFDVGGKREK